MIPQRGKAPAAWQNKEPQMRLILDSGAFSAWSLGFEVNLDDYCEFIKRNQSWVSAYVALDAISQNSHDPVTKMKAAEAAAAQSYENLLYMRSKGLDPVPVVHVAESYEWLDRILDLGCKYIGISASSLASRNEVDDWYAGAWARMVDSEGLPVVKVHAFGEGRFATMKKFPWFSADSASWIYQAQRAGKFVFNDGHGAAQRNDGKSDKASPDINCMDEENKKYFNKILADSGILAKAFDDFGSPALVMRTYITMRSYIYGANKVNECTPVRFVPKESHTVHKGFFDPGPSPRPAIEIPQMHFHFVVGTNNTTYALLAHEGYRDILASYFYIEPPTAKARKVIKPGKAVPSKHKTHDAANLEHFVRDPLDCVQTNETFLKYWNILQEHLDHAK